MYHDQKGSYRLPDKLQYSLNSVFEGLTFFFFFLLCNFWFTPVLQTLCNSLFLSLAQSLHEKKNIPPKIEVVFVCLFLTVSGHIDFFFKKQTLKFMANTFVGLLVLFKNKLPFSISLC